MQTRVDQDGYLEAYNARRRTWVRYYVIERQPAEGPPSFALEDTLGAVVVQATSRGGVALVRRARPGDL